MPDTDDEDATNIDSLDRPIMTIHPSKDMPVTDLPPEKRQIHAPVNSVSRGRPIIEPRQIIAGDDTGPTGDEE